MIPEAAVEAAAELLALASPEDWSGDQWANEKIDDSYREPWRKQARLIIEAAAPHMLTRITNAAINRAYEDGRASAITRLADAYDEGLEAGDGLRPRGNPYL